MSQFNCDHRFLLPAEPHLSQNWAKSQKLIHIWTFKRLKSRTIISHEKSHSSCASLIVSKNVDIYNYKWMDWQRSQECSISIFHCIFGKGRKYGWALEFGISSAGYWLHLHVRRKIAIRSIQTVYSYQENFIASGSNFSARWRFSNLPQYEDNIQRRKAETQKL